MASRVFYASKLEKTDLAASGYKTAVLAHSQGQYNVRVRLQGRSVKGAQCNGVHNRRVVGHDDVGLARQRKLHVQDVVVVAYNLASQHA